MEHRTVDSLELEALNIDRPLELVRAELQRFRCCDHLLQSRLFRVRDDTAIATLADDWHRALIAKGFEDLPVDEPRT